jgi:hypothetical protein
MPVKTIWRLAFVFAYACPAKMPGDGGPNATVVGYARVSTSGQDLAT